MISAHVLVFVAAAFVMMPPAVGLKASPNDKLFVPGSGAYESSAASERGLFLSARNTVQSNQATIFNSYSAAHPIEIILENRGSQPVAFMKFGTPFEDKIHYNVIRSVPNTSHPIELGDETWAEHNSPKQDVALQQDALITLEPNGKVTKIIDAVQFLAFDQPGSYQVFVDFPIELFDPNDDQQVWLPTAATHAFISAEFNLNVTPDGVTPNQRAE